MVEELGFETKKKEGSKPHTWRVTPRKIQRNGNYRFHFNKLGFSKLILIYFKKLSLQAYI